jgi:hypothetical protein
MPILDRCRQADLDVVVHNRVVDLLHWQQKRKPLRQRSSPEMTRRSQRSRRTKWSSRPDKGEPTSCIAPPIASDPRSIATNPVLLINSITSF